MTGEAEEICKELAMIIEITPLFKEMILNQLIVYLFITDINKR